MSITKQELLDLVEQARYTERIARGRKDIDKALQAEAEENLQRDLDALLAKAD